MYWMSNASESALLHFDVPVNDADSNTFYISVTPMPDEYPLENVSILPVPEGGIPIYEFKREMAPFVHTLPLYIFNGYLFTDYRYLKLKGKRTITVCGLGGVFSDFNKIIAKGLTLDLSQVTNLRAANLRNCDIAVKTLILPLSATVTSDDRETISKLLEKTKNIIYR